MYEFHGENIEKFSIVINKKNYKKQLLFHFGRIDFDRFDSAAVTRVT